MNEHTADLQSFPVLSTNGHRNNPRGFIRRFLFVIILAVLVTITVFGAITAVLVKAKQNTNQWSDSKVSGMDSSSYWIIEDGSVIVSRDPYHTKFDTDSACSTTLWTL